ncbi:CocE/NonD family hydrolase [Mesorhizobium sp. M1076]|uniref:CocE/NonD family hydrolase n=1 Tax=Mesorhizobium sp. M1076 TaxID=2957054 RepID=UPI00333DC0E1
MTTTTNFAPQFGVRVITGVRIAMCDGVELNVRITRPDAPGRFPAVLEYNPYRRLAGAVPDYRDEYPPVVPYLAERGYVVVQYDVRGTGSSSGFSTDMYSDDERRDGYDMVEWCAAQDWCTGAVGMVGKSYAAVVQWQVAAQNPPHLKAIVVRSGGVDLAPEFSNPGGCIRPWMFESYAPLMSAFNFSPPDALLTGDRWAAIWQERLENSAPWGLGFIRNLQQGQYWRSRSVTPDYDRIQCAVLLIEGWADWYASAELRAYQRLRSPRKVLIGPWGHYYAEEKEAFPGPRIDARREYLTWFDHFLKGMENGVTDEPPVTVFVRGWQMPTLVCPEDAGTWRNEAEWPPERVRNTEFFFGNAGKLADAAQDGSESYEYRPSVGLTTGRLGLGSTTPWGMPLDQRLDDAYSVLYESESFTTETELLGEPEAILHVSSTAHSAFFAVRLCDVAPDGQSRLITDGGLLASHRNGADNDEPLVPNEVTEVHFPLKHCAYAIPPGHRLRVAVSSALFQNAWPTGQSARNTIHRGFKHPSRVVLPIAMPGQEHLPPPDFVDSDVPQASPETMPQPTYTLHQDLVADQVTCELVTGDAGSRIVGCNRSRYTVSNRNPAQTTIDASFSYRAPHPTLDIRIEAACQTTSDSASYTHAVQIGIQINGHAHFQKSWTESVPRKWS